MPSKDILVIPICVGTKSPQKTKDLLAEFQKEYDIKFPNNEVLLMLYKDSQSFYYPIILKANNE